MNSQDLVTASACPPSSEFELRQVGTMGRAGGRPPRPRHWQPTGKTRRRPMPGPRRTGIVIVR